jgi:hypothetical protein
MATTAVEFEEGLVPQVTRAGAALRTKAVLVRMEAAAKRQAALLGLLVSAHENAEFSEAESLSYTASSLQNGDWERMKALRDALKEEAKVCGQDEVF